MTDQTDYAEVWVEALTRLLHPTQLLILEAISRLEQPTSASKMAHISDNQISLASYDYHFKRLVDLGLLRLVDEVQRRGTCEKLYDFWFGEEN